MKQTDIDTVLEEVRTALTQEDWNRAAALVESLRPPDQADVFEELSIADQEGLLPILDPEDSADILEELPDDDAAEIAGRLEADELARILDRMEPDEAADLLGDIPREQVDQALLAVRDAEEIRPLLEFGDQTAGGLMTSAEIVLHKDITAEAAIRHIRSISPDTETVYYLFVVDDEIKLVGVISLRELILADPASRIAEIMDPEVFFVNAATDQEEAARLMARYDLLALPVVDDNTCLLGVITHDDLVDVLEEEATEDIYRLGGIPDETVSEESIFGGLRTRLPWLVLNLGTAMVSVAVLSVFESTIAAAAILAAFFPIVAGVSGSAGTQTLTVTVRGIALGEISRRNGVRNLIREISIGLIDGVVLGLLIAAIAYIWKNQPVLGLVVGVSVFLNMITAAVAGFLVPWGFQIIRIDPALASPVLVTTLTDTIGYFIYLGIASILLIQML